MSDTNGRFVVQVLHGESPDVFWNDRSIWHGSTADAMAWATESLEDGDKFRVVRAGDVCVIKTEMLRKATVSVVGGAASVAEGAGDE